VARRVRAHGRVQGVYFRESTRRGALAAGVGGWVLNRADGSVEALFEEPGADVEALVDWCRVGPPGAIVERIEVNDEALTGVTGFAVR
jgi:acylphosphatase